MVPFLGPNRVRLAVRSFSSPPSDSSSNGCDTDLKELPRVISALESLSKSIVRKDAEAVNWHRLDFQKRDIDNVLKSLRGMAKGKDIAVSNGGVVNTKAYGPTGALNPLLVEDESERALLREEAKDMPFLIVTARQRYDLELLLNGGFSPLDGFMNEDTYESVMRDMRLNDEAKTLWPVPIVLDVSEYDLMKFQGAPKLALKDEAHNIIAVIEVGDIYRPDKEIEAKLIYGTEISSPHPGCQRLMSHTGEYYIGGKVKGIKMPKHYNYHDLRRTPEETRAIFREKKWDRVVAYHARNPIHRAQFEMTSRIANEFNAGLFVHPAIGQTRNSDIDRHTRIKCYRAILPRYKDNTAFMSGLPLSMRFAGPREAMWHAIIRKNYGATHFIVGSDHSGPGRGPNGKNFYEPFAAYELCRKHEAELGITILSPYALGLDYYFSTDQKRYMTKGEAKETEDTTLEPLPSGTVIRNMLAAGDTIPSWITFKEVAEVLKKSFPKRLYQGFCVFFTGLSGSGKSTIALALREKLKDIDDRSVALLDGERVRKVLSSELGFSEEERNLNIKRLGWVASHISSSGAAAIVAPIAPYKEGRAQARKYVSDVNARFVEVYMSTSIETCEKFDKKGIYVQARQGKIRNFTGIDDPYEAPEKPEITIDSSQLTVEEAADRIIFWLQAEGYLK